MGPQGSLTNPAGVPPLAGRAWRLILDGFHGPWWNMAADEAILDAVAVGMAPATLRLYRWLVPAVSVGLHQSVPRTIDVAGCARLGVPIVRRPTGGRAILHGGDQTLSIVVPIAHLGAPGASVAGSYALLSAGLVCALADLGVALVPGAERARPGGGGDCFAVRTRADLVTSHGHKVVGAAQRRRAGILLQQVSVRHRPISAEPSDVFLGPAAVPAHPLEGITDSALEATLVRALGQALGIRMRTGGLTAWEEERACVLQAELQAESHGWLP